MATDIKGHDHASIFA